MVVQDRGMVTPAGVSDKRCKTSGAFHQKIASPDTKSLAAKIKRIAGPWPGSSSRSGEIHLDPAKLAQIRDTLGRLVEMHGLDDTAEENEFSGLQGPFLFAA
jgi:hypothetical protein